MQGNILHGSGLFHYVPPWIVVAFVQCFLTPLRAQENSLVVIDTVVFEGLVRTKPHVVWREMQVGVKDTLSLTDMERKLALSQARLESTNLFTTCTLYVTFTDSTNQHGWLHIKVTENWFFYPYLIFELADRNPSVWWKEQHASLARVNAGAGLHHINLTGHNDRLKCRIHGGYTRKLDVSYEMPYLWRNWGVSGQVYYADQKEVAYRSYLNKPLFFQTEDEQPVFSHRRLAIAVHHRASPFIFQTIRMEHHDIRVHDQIAGGVNRLFLGAGRARVAVPALEYQFRFDNTKYPLYPVSGFRVDARIRKEGFSKLADIRTLSISVRAEYVSPLWKKLMLVHQVRGKVQLVSQPLPYYFQQGIGYKEDKLTGYDLFVLDGRNFAFINHALTYQIVGREFYLGKVMPIAYRSMDVKAFIRYSFDVGYAYDPLFGASNPYSNSIQYGFGPGLDLLFFHTISLSVTYGQTRFGFKGLYVNYGLVF